MIRVFDRASGLVMEEKVLGGKWLSWGYAHPVGRLVTASSIFQRGLTRAMGAWNDSSFSRSGIDGFVRDYGIDLSQFESPAQGYGSFNDFFIRKLRPGTRPFPGDAKVLGAPAEGRLSVFALNGKNTPLIIKGQELPLGILLGSDELAREFIGGHAFVFRLCPVDYHRFHFPDAGTPGPSTRLGSQLHSVNPVAHQHIPDIFVRNERQLCRFESKHFGPLLLLEVGATCVGRIVQTHTPGRSVERGAEKGYFAFGGSTTLMLSQGKRVRPDADLVQKTHEGLESLVRLGEGIAHAV